MSRRTRSSSVDQLSRPRKEVNKSLDLRCEGCNRFESLPLSPLTTTPRRFTYMLVGSGMSYFWHLHQTYIYTTFNTPRRQHGSILDVFAIETQ